MANLRMIQDLLYRAQNMEGPNRELDGRIMFGLFAKPCGERGYLWPEDNASWAFAFRFERSSKLARSRVGGETIEWQCDDGSWILMNQLRVPPLTSSIDEALKLLRRDYPGVGIILESGYRGPYSCCTIRRQNSAAFTTGSLIGQQSRPDDEMPLAIITAYLMAKEAENANAEDDIDREDPAHDHA